MLSRNKNIIPRPEGPKRLSGPAQSWDYTLGDFSIRWAEREAQLLIAHRAQEETLLATPPGEAFLATARAKLRVDEQRGFFRLHSLRPTWYTEQSVEAWGADQLDGATSSVWIKGQLKEKTGSSLSWRVDISLSQERQLTLRCEVEDQREAAGSRGDQLIVLSLTGTPEERIYGAGVQLTHLNLKGRAIPLLSQEPGIGRGIQPLSAIAELAFKAAGDQVSSSHPAALYHSDRGRSCAIEDHESGSLDFREPTRHRLSLRSTTLTLHLFAGAHPLDRLEAMSAMLGRMPPPPPWSQRGAIIGAQGGSSAIRALDAALREAEVPVAAYWLQDWCGARRTAVGEQLWWHWELDQTRYPGWDALCQQLGEQGRHVLGYINPFLIDPAVHGRPYRRNFYQEAERAGYLVTRADGSPYRILNTSFSAGLVDLSNEAACAWLQEIIEQELVGNGFSGWMADFGEALPFDAQLAGGDAASFHNAYPERWAALNRAASETPAGEPPRLPFHRSGYTRSVRSLRMSWLGDQLTGWRKEDGLAGALVGHLSGGISGISQLHGDIGGYCATTFPRFPWLRIPGVNFQRSRELLWRWIELAAFTPLFRTHEGNQPQQNHQLADCAESRRFFARFAQLFAALAPYRARLSEEATARGWPLMRALWLVAPEDAVGALVDDQFFLGDLLLIAPVLTPQATERELYLPAGRWTHLWSSVTLEGAAHYRVSAPLGTPPVFYHAESSEGAALAALICEVLAHQPARESFRAKRCP
ncbi:MAG: alpha-glucosidase [Myxococcota bacterium]|nr:alpha-glucosidase [Myxococcota bacterium]